MSVKDFDKTFGLTSSIDEEKKRFINRINNSVLDLITNELPFEEYEAFFMEVCFNLGEDAKEIIKRHGDRNTVPILRVLSHSDFIKTLRLIVALYQSSKNDGNLQKFISNRIIESLNRCATNIGIKWGDGVFYPSGEKILDQELIDTSLQILEKFPNEKKDLKNALNNYYSKSLYGVVENCYIAVEGLSRKLLRNNKTLDNNQTELLKTLEFSKYWDKLFLNYLMYAHEYRRHAGENRHNLKEEEVEAFLYLTCLIIRSTVKANGNKT